MTTQDGSERASAPPTMPSGDPDATVAWRQPESDSRLEHGARPEPGRQPAREEQPREATQRPVAVPREAAAGESTTTVLPQAERRVERPLSRPEPRPAPSPARAQRVQPRPGGRGRRARLVLQRVDPWSVFLFSLVASICLGVALIVAVAALFFVLSNLGVLSSVNNLLGEVFGGSEPDQAIEPVFTLGRVLGATAVLAAVDVVLLTVLSTLGALLYNLCASLTGGVEVVLGERE